MNKIELISSIKEQLQLSEFKEITDGVSIISLRKKEKYKKEDIIFTYKKYPGIFILDSCIIGEKTIFEIETILGEYFTKYNVPYSDTTIFTVSRRNEKMSEFEIANESDIEQIMPSLSDMVYLDILPFFENYQTLGQVYEKVESMQLDKMSNFIFSPMPIRRMVLKCLVKEPNWEEYAKEVLGTYKEHSTGKYTAAFAPFYQFMPELFEELKQMDVDDYLKGFSKEI